MVIFRYLSNPTPHLRIAVPKSRTLKGVRRDVDPFLDRQTRKLKVVASDVCDIGGMGQTGRGDILSPERPGIVLALS